MTGLNYVLNCLQAEVATLLVLAGVCLGGTATMPLAQTSASAAIAQTDPTPQHSTTSFDVVGVLREFGPLVVLVLWFAWRDGDREKRMANRIAELETFQREFLAERLKVSIETQDQVSAALEKLTEVIEGCRHRTT